MAVEGGGALALLALRASLPGATLLCTMLFNTLLSGSKLVPRPAPGTTSPLLGPALGTASPWPPCCCAAPAGRDVLADVVLSTAWNGERP